MAARPASREHNRGLRLVALVSLVSLAIPAVAAAQPGGLSIPTATVLPLNVAALTNRTQPPAQGPTREEWLADGAKVGARQRAALSAEREPVPPPSPVAAAPAVPWRAASGQADWYAIAQCESGGRWDLNTGNGFWGGLQFLPSTWFAYGGGSFDGSGAFPYSAAQQIAVAERVLAGQGAGAWPNCFAWA